MIDLITPINTLKESLEKVQLNEQNTATYERLKVLISILENRINGLGVIVCNPTYLNNIASYLSSIQNYVNSDIANSSSGAYRNLSGQIDNIIAQLPHIPATEKTDIKQSLNQIINTYKKQNESIIEKIKQEKNELEKEVSSLKQKVSTLEQQINNKEQELTTLSESFKQQFTSSQNQRDQSARERLDNTLLLWDEAGRKYSEQIKNNEEEIQKKFDEKYEDLKQQTASIIGYMEERQEEIKKIYGLVGEIVSCGEYKKYAQKEHSFANITFWGAFILMCISASILVGAMIYDIFWQKSFSWISLLTKLPIAIILLLPASYMAIESRRHRNQELALRDFEIKIANIDPYLKNIDFVESERENTRQAIPEGSKTARDLKIELAKEFFSIKQVKDTDNIVIPKDMIELIEKFMAFCDRKDK